MAQGSNVASYWLAFLLVTIVILAILINNVAHGADPNSEPFVGRGGAKLGAWLGQTFASYMRNSKRNHTSY